MKAGAFCRGRHACEALQVEALGASDWAYEVIPLEIPVGAASRELRNMTRAMKLMEARVTGLQEMLLAKLRKGDQVPGFQIWPIDMLVSFFLRPYHRLAMPREMNTDEKIEAFLPSIDGAIQEGLATLEKVEVRFYRHRGQ